MIYSHTWPKLLPALFLLMCSLLRAGIAAEQPAEILTLEREPLPPGIHSLLPHQQIVQPGVTLALSGGGARGGAHLGVLRALEEYHVPVRGIAGTSAGALFGALYALGYRSEDILLLIRSLKLDNLFMNEPERWSMFVPKKRERLRRVLEVRFDGWDPDLPRGFLTGQELSNILEDLVIRSPYSRERDFDRFSVPVRIITTDLVTGEEIVFREGNLAQAVMASVAVPVVFRPVRYQDRLLVDGGLVNTIPVDVARSMASGPVIAVDVSPVLLDKSDLNLPWQVMDQVFKIMQQEKNRANLALADLVITPQLDKRSVTNFGALLDLEKIGYDAAVARMNDIQRLVSPSPQQQEMTPLTIVSVAVTTDDGGNPEQEIPELSAQSSPAVTRAAIRADLRELYATGDYTDVRAELYTTGIDTFRLQYRVTPNPVIRQVQVVGTTVFSPDSLILLLGTRAERRYNHHVGMQDYQNIRQYYTSAGMALSSLEFCTFDTTNGTLCLNISEGRINRIRTESTDPAKRLKTRESILLDEIGLKPGDVFNIETVRNGIRRIYGTGLFRRVTYTLDPAPEGIDLVLQAEEKNWVVIQAGGRYDTDRQTLAYLKAGIENLFGNGSEISISDLFGDRDKALEGRLRADRLFDSPWHTTVRGYYRDRQHFVEPRAGAGNYSSVYRLGGAVAVGSVLSRFGDVTLEGRFEYVDLRSDSTTGLNDSYTLRSLVLRSVVDTQNQYPFPESGYYHEMFLESAGRILGGRRAFSRLFATIHGYITTAESHTLHPSMTVAIADNATPWPEWFHIGGMQSFYGLKEGIWAGRSVYTGGLEYRYRIPRVLPVPAYVHLQYQIGAVSARASRPRFRDVKQAAGGGLSIDLPFGPAGLYYGKTTRSSDRYGNDRVYFSIGYDLQ